MIGAILDSLKGELDLIFKIEISFFVIKVCIGNNLSGNKKIPRRNANASGGGRREYIEAKLPYWQHEVAYSMAGIQEPPISSMAFLTRES